MYLYIVQKIVGQVMRKIENAVKCDKHVTIAAARAPLSIKTRLLINL